MSLSNIPTVVAACCILHNVCEVHGERFNDQWLESLSELPQPPTASHRDDTATDAPKEMRCFGSLFFSLNAVVTSLATMYQYFHYCNNVKINAAQCACRDKII